eukprot:gnl/TRDRNA2_/TRDRNA2_193023_c0_seq1.p1 gnl/TRDRNA2_/TRDRNA2_193023_c0~~gnl/TRDRNA2_/TRDRNA2_193023_c0_seq1.p1  ORF type:complete len:384 (-),score=69.06 gnl/TRDRNA2_/TRDRNA2_193023_c0_seq1:95-1192(-)
MGAHLGCRQCDRCRDCTSCPRQRCGALCLLGSAKMEMIQALPGDTQEEFPADREHTFYSAVGEDCPAMSEVCGEIERADGEIVYDHISQKGGAPNATTASGLDQVLPLQVDPPFGVESGRKGIPNIQERKAIETLEDECRFNQGKLRKIRELAQTYGHWRPIRGDGNCYYRTVIFGALEALVKRGDRERLEGIVNILQQVRYEVPAEQCAHDEMLQNLRSAESTAQLEKWVANNTKLLDEALIRGCRRIVRQFLTREENRATYSELVKAIPELQEYQDIEDFCDQEVDPMGQEAQYFPVPALPEALGVGLKIWFLDRDEAKLTVTLEHFNSDGKVDVHALFKPGHYDLLYLRGETLSSSDTTVAV